MNFLWDALVTDFWSIITKIGLLQILGWIGSKMIRRFTFWRNEKNELEKEKAKFAKLLKLANEIPDPLNGFDKFHSATKRCLSRIDLYQDRKEIVKLTDKLDELRDIVSDMQGMGKGCSLKLFQDIKDFKI